MFLIKIKQACGAAVFGLGLVAFAGGVGGCAGGNGGGNVASDKHAPNLDGFYRLQNAPQTLEINGGEINGNAGINLYGGKISYETNSVKIKVEYTTKMAGDPESMRSEDAFLQGFGGRFDVRVSGGEMTLSRGERKFVFVKSQKGADE